MFRKPFKPKFESQLKNSDKKKFGNDLMSLFPALTDSDISTIVNSKTNIVRIKAVTFKEEDVEIYSMNKMPMYVHLIDSDIKLPTVFMLWRFPHMVPCVTINATVLSKLKNGTDLFFPGVYREGLHFYKEDFKKNDKIAINLINNKAAMAIGISLSNKDILLNSPDNKSVGRVVKVYHTEGDFLFKMYNDAVVPQLGPPEWALQVKEDSVEDIDTNTHIETTAEIVNCTTEKVVELSVDDSENIVTTQSNEKSEELKEENFDENLVYCFLKALKTIPKDSYPILPATFYAKYVLPSLPEGKTLNLKKTKWKKFSTFLKEKSLEGLIKLQPLPKNDFTIAEVNKGHQELKGFVDPYTTVSVTAEPKLGKPTVQQIYLVSGATLPFFVNFGLKKYDQLTRNDVRNYLNDYIKSENLIHPTNPEFVVLNPVLYQIFKVEVLGRGALLSSLMDKMNIQHQVFAHENGDAILHKGKMPVIEFETFMKKGNKKVTVISNLESYGVNVINFSKELQHKAAASTTILPTVPGKKGPQIQVQGNQIAIAFSILKEKYNFHEKFMKGLDKAVKSKNKK